MGTGLAQPKKGKREDDDNDEQGAERVKVGQRIPGQAAGQPGRGVAVGVRHRAVGQLVHHDANDEHNEDYEPVEQKVQGHRLRPHRAGVL
jgi:hypothetical protein